MAVTPKGNLSSDTMSDMGECERPATEAAEMTAECERPATVAAERTTAVVEAAAAAATEAAMVEVVRVASWWQS